jgi:hypothetical protein
VFKRSSCSACVCMDPPPPSKTALAEAFAPDTPGGFTLTYPARPGQAALRLAARRSSGAAAACGGRRKRRGRVQRGAQAAATDEERWGARSRGAAPKGLLVFPRNTNTALLVRAQKAPWTSSGLKTMGPAWRLRSRAFTPQASIMASGVRDDVSHEYTCFIRRSEDERTSSWSFPLRAWHYQRARTDPFRA